MKLITKSYKLEDDEQGYDVETLTGALPFLGRKLEELGYLSADAYLPINGYGWEMGPEAEDLDFLVRSIAKVRIETDSRDDGYTLVTMILDDGDRYFVGAEPVGLRGYQPGMRPIDLYDLPIKWAVRRLTYRLAAEPESVYHSIHFGAGTGQPGFSALKVKSLIHAAVGLLDLYGEHSYTAMHGALDNTAARETAAKARRQARKTTGRTATVSGSSWAPGTAYTLGDTFRSFFAPAPAPAVSLNMLGGEYKIDRVLVSPAAQVTRQPRREVMRPDNLCPAENGCVHCDQEWEILKKF